MTASAARTYVNRYAVAPGRKIVLFVNNDDGWRTASDLNACGLEVEAIIDCRPEVAAKLRAGVDCRVFLNAAACDTRGGHRVRSVLVRTTRGTERINCDLLAVSGGWEPNLGLTCHLGGGP